MQLLRLLHTAHSSAGNFFLLMHREPNSHKGENGKVCIIGGSRHMHGAPLFAALAAEASGVDLIYVFVPPAHEEVSKNASFNFQVHTFREDELSTDDTGPVLQMLASMDTAVIGPGLSRRPETLSAIEQIISGAPCPLVIDASALQTGTLGLIAGRGAVLTPHLGELERMGIPHDEVAQRAHASGSTFLIKGEADLIYEPDGQLHESTGGNAGLTVGGTGDALAGLTAGLMAQHMPAQEAALLASKVIKHAADMLMEQQGYAYTAREVIELIPIVLHQMDDSVS